MSREWKPGDVAMLVSHGGTPAVRAPEDCGVGGHGYAKDHWHYLANVGGATWDSNGDREARPLVLLDLNDKERAALLDYAESTFHFRSETLSSIRKQCEPPKPVEPLGLGAVVEDGRRMLFVRCADGWLCAGAEGREPGEYRNSLAWDELLCYGVPRVLSEGIQP